MSKKHAHPKKKPFLIGILYISITVSVTIPIAIHVVNSAKPESPTTQKPSKQQPMERVETLQPGVPVPQKFVAKVPIHEYKPGNTVGFEVMDTVWPHPFWFPATVKNGYAYCDFSVGRPENNGRLYQITGYCLATNVTIPSGTELKKPISGRIFYGPADHKRM